MARVRCKTVYVADGKFHQPGSVITVDDAVAAGYKHLFEVIPAAKKASPKKSTKKDDKQE